MLLDKIVPAVVTAVETSKHLGASALGFFGNNLIRLSNLLEVKKGGEVVEDIVVDEIAPEGLGFGGGKYLAIQKKMV